MMVVTKLTWHWNVRNQINTIENLKTKLKYVVNDRDQINYLPLNKINTDFLNKLKKACTTVSFFLLNECIRVFFVFG